MKTFIAIPSAAIAASLLVGASANDTQIRRRRNVVIGEKSKNDFGRQSTPMEKQKHRQMERGGDRTRTGGGDHLRSPDQSMPIVQTEISMPVEPACEILTKKKCKSDESCTWDGTSCFASTGEVIESFLKVPGDGEEAEEVVQVDDACAEYPSYRKCKKDSNCSWNGSVCHANEVVVESIDTDTPTWFPTSPYPSWFPTSPPTDEVIDWGSMSMSIGLVEAQVEETPIPSYYPTYFPTYVPTSEDMSMAMPELGERFLPEDAQINWVDTPVVDDPTPTYSPSSWYPTYVPTSEDMSMAIPELGERYLEVLEEDMSLPKVTIEMNFLEVGDGCTALIKKGQCKKNEACAWDADKLKCKTLDVSPLVEASIAIDFEGTTEGEEEVVCRDLRKGQCKNYDTCAWDRDKLKCLAAPVDEIAAVLEITEEEEGTSVVCSDLRKGKCKNNDSCQWNFNKLKCMSKPSAVQIEEIQDGENASPTNSPTNPGITPFPTTAALEEEVVSIDTSCAPHGKKRCEKKEACIWDSTVEVCQSISMTSEPTSSPREPTPSPSVSPVTSNPTSSPRDMNIPLPESVVDEDVTIGCEVLRRKMCQKETACEWDGTNNVCHTSSSVVAPEETDQIEIDMSMPESIDPIVCEELTTIRLCKKNMPQCTYWYDSEKFVCHSAPSRRLLRGGPTISRRQYHRQMMSMPEMEMLSIPEKIVEEDPCAELSKKQCKKNDDMCTWGEDTCFTTPK